MPSPSGSLSSAGTRTPIRRPIPVGGVTAAQQATYTANFIAEVGAGYPYVTAVFVYNGVDAIGDSAPDVRYAGILDFNLVPKPVYWAIAHLYGH